MTDELIAIFGAVGLALIGLIYLLVGWSRRRSTRAVLRGLGLMLLAAGLWVTGVMGLLVTGVRGLVDWFRAEALDTQMWVGIGLGIVGLLLFVVGGFIAPVIRADAKAARLEREKTATPASGRPIPPARPSAAPASKSSLDIGSSADDAEVERILKSRDIT